VQEHDTFYTGNITMFLHSVHRNLKTRADFLAVYRPPLPEWKLYKVGSMGLPAVSRRHVFEHLVRFSSGLLTELVSLIEAGMVLHGESFAASVCAYNPECRAVDLCDVVRGHIGVPYSPFDEISVDQFHQFMASSDPEVRDKWFHKLRHSANHTSATDIGVRLHRRDTEECQGCGYCQANINKTKEVQVE